ncbi:toluene-4-monooxygenase system B family protein [Nonomuraea sp. NPDC052129]|uniref:toluene-4-monooxygenase system B family protein n=1 Tax=Nonomuraea sp. NPDC052129 TaxID=3154651 RepID=UPI0034297C6F
MALLPLSANFENDVFAMLVPVDDQDTAQVVGQKIAEHAVGHRVAAGSVPIRVRHEGRVLPPEQRIGEAGVGPLDHVEAFFDES